MNREERRKWAKDVKLVGRRIPGVSMGQIPSVKHLGSQVDEVLREVQDIKTPRQKGHVPVVGPLFDPEGCWGVFCWACTLAGGSFTYPCEVDDDQASWPPQVLTAHVPSPIED